MRNYIILNDQNSNSISGLLIQSLAPISKPLMRTEIEEIDGRDGDITTKLGYSAYDKQITIGLFGNYDVDQVIAFFNSEGTAIFSNEPDKYYNYQIVDQIDFERLVRYKTATVTMHCQPFKYSTTEGADILSSSDNFATLNQSLNTDSGFYTYSSNVQADVTATRQSGTGGKFFAVFTVPVVQGVNYHFSGNVSRNVSMYGYTDQLRGTSAGIAGKGFSGNFVYTATFTGTMVLGFYSSATTEIFIRNFAISNEAGTTISDEGTSLVLEGSALAPFSQFDLKGNTEQDGTPTPSAPVPVKVVTGENTVKIAGKNLFDISATTGKTSNGLTTTKDGDGGLHITGTATSTWADLTENQAIELKNGVTYTLSAGGVSPITLTAYIGDPRQNVSIDAGQRSKTFVADSDKSYFHFYCSGLTSGASYDFTIKSIQIEKNNQSTDYEPYQNQSYEVNLGKNLLDEASVMRGYELNGTTGAIVESANWWVSDIIPVMPNTPYTSSGWDNNNTNKYWYRSDNSYIERTSGKTVTSPSDAAYMRVNGRLTQLGKTIMVEQGSTATDYAPYFTPIELCKIGTYQDYIYKSGDKWYKHKAINKIIENGSQTWYRAGTATSGKYMLDTDINDMIVMQSTSVAPPVFCTRFTPKSFNDLQNNIIGISGRQVGRSGVYIYDDVHFVANDFKNWLVSNPMTIYYPLATPVDEEITDSTLIEQLNDIAEQAHAYKTRTYVGSTYATGNEPFIIAATVVGDASGTITNAGNIYSKPKLTVYGSGDIGIYLNGVQMFQIALGSDGYITIDTNLMEAYKDNLQTLKNRQVTGDYSNFKLPVGSSTISFSGVVTSCVVENYSRWL